MSWNVSITSAINRNIPSALTPRTAIPQNVAVNAAPRDKPPRYITMDLRM